MKKFILVLLICWSASTAAFAQKIVKNKAEFHSINNLILINGSNGTTAGLQTVNGFSNKSIFVGIGLGLDYYQYRSIPFFADIRYTLPSKKANVFFIYTDAGINFNWIQEWYKSSPSIWNLNRNNSFKNGFYSDAGIGLLAPFKNGNAFVLSLGYSGKALEEIITNDDPRAGTTQTTINKYRLRRMLLKAGFRF